MPVYNEEEIIQKVIKSWIKTLDDLSINYVVYIYNDGSKDNTLKKISELLPKYPRLNVVDKKNSGHGPTILEGYKNAESEWVFQTDSDNEMDCQYFNTLWMHRNDFDFLIGIRENRINPVSRKMITLISKLMVKLLYGKAVIDVNSPFRMYRVNKFKKYFSMIPNNTFAPNIILSGIASLQKFRIYQTNIPCSSRQTGEVSIKRMRLLKVAIKSSFQTILFRINYLLNKS